MQNNQLHMQILWNYLIAVLYTDMYVGNAFDACDSPLFEHFSLFFLNKNTNSPNFSVQWFP